jgi:LL-diaminopimelate aminotransferase
VGDPTEETPEIVRKATQKAVDDRKSSGYPNYQGSLDFREAVSAWLKRRFGLIIDPVSEICCTIGSKESVFNFHECLINPSDIVLCPSPGYPPYSRGTIFAEGIPWFYPVTKENNFYPDLERIPAGVMKKTRLIWINYPNSPTGKVADEHFYREVIEFARRHEIVIASDEAYTEIYYKNKPHSILEFGKEGIIVFQSLSKRSAMTCYRIGFIAGDSRLIRLFRNLKTNVDSGTPTFIQDGAVSALSDEFHVEKMRESYKRKRDLLIRAFIDAGLEDCTPEGTLYIWQKVFEGMSGEEFARTLLREDTAIVCTPGNLLADPVEQGINPGRDYVRFALVPSEEETFEAAQRIRNALKK